MLPKFALLLDELRFSKFHFGGNTLHGSIAVTDKL